MKVKHTKALMRAAREMILSICCHVFMLEKTCGAGREQGEGVAAVSEPAGGSEEGLPSVVMCSCELGVGGGVCGLLQRGHTWVFVRLLMCANWKRAAVRTCDAVKPVLSDIRITYF